MKKKKKILKIVYSIFSDIDIARLYTRARIILLYVFYCNIKRLNGFYRFISTCIVRRLIRAWYTDNNIIIDIVRIRKFVFRSSTARSKTDLCEKSYFVAFLGRRTRVFCITVVVFFFLVIVLKKNSSGRKKKQKKNPKKFLLPVQTVSGGGGEEREGCGGEINIRLFILI